MTMNAAQSYLYNKRCGFGLLFLADLIGSKGEADDITVIGMSLDARRLLIRENLNDKYDHFLCQLSAFSGKLITFKALSLER